MSVSLSLITDAMSWLSPLSSMTGLQSFVFSVVAPPLCNLDIMPAVTSVDIFLAGLSSCKTSLAQILRTSFSLSVIVLMSSF